MGYFDAIPSFVFFQKKVYFPKSAFFTESFDFSLREFWFKSRIYLKVAYFHACFSTHLVWFISYQYSSSNGCKIKTVKTSFLMQCHI